MSGKIKTVKTQPNLATREYLQSLFKNIFNYRGEGEDKERERNIDWLPLRGTKPATQACALTGN